MCWAIELSSAVVQRIVDEVPALGGHPAAIGLLRRGNDATTLRMLLALAGTRAGTGPVMEDIHEFVHRAIP